MINDLDATLRQLLIQQAGIDPNRVEINFDLPPRNWTPDSKGPLMVNLYLYDIRENRQLREMDWETSEDEPGKKRMKRLPVRIDLAYMITCWTNDAEDHHRLLWSVLAALFRNSPLPERFLKGSLQKLLYPLRTEVAQPDGVLKNLSDFWGAMENQVRPAVNLVVTLELDLEQIELVPLVFSETIKLGQGAVGRDVAGGRSLAPGWEGEARFLGGQVHTPEEKAIPGASVRLLVAEPGSPPVQFRGAVQTDNDGRYLFDHIPRGSYTLEVTTPGGKALSYPLVIEIRPRDQVVIPIENELTHNVEVPIEGSLPGETVPSKFKGKR